MTRIVRILFHIVAIVSAIGIASGITDPRLVNACVAGETELNFTGYDLGDSGIGDLAECLAIVEDTLKYLTLGSNSFTELPSDIFTSLNVIETLNLSQNPISELPAGLFAGLDTLTRLVLSDLLLTKLRSDTFEGLPLYLLYLDNNQLTTLPADLFDGLPLSILSMWGNQDLECVPSSTAAYVPAGSDSSSLGFFSGPCGCTPTDAAVCEVGTCQPGDTGYTCISECSDGINVCSDPHMRGLRGQMIDWSGVDGGWYCLVTDDEFDIHVNVRLTAPLPVEFPDRQLITGMIIVSEGHSLVVEVKNPYTIDTEGCEDGTRICLANGGVRVVVDGEEDYDLILPTRDANVAGPFTLSSSNLPVECRQFGGDRIWARMYAEMLQGTRELSSGTFEDWVMDFGNMAAPDWCAKYIAERGLDGVQSIHSVLKIQTRDISVRLNVGIGYQIGGQIDWDGRVLPDLEFWQMDVGLDGLSLEHELMSGILGETARPVLDEEGVEVMKGYDAFRGTVEDYRVAAATETDFTQLHQTIS